MAYYDTLRAVAVKVLSQIIGGLALILLAGSLAAVYSHALGVSVW